MKRVRLLWLVLSLALLGSGAGCYTPHVNGFSAARLAQQEAILREPPGDYFIGRRYYSSYYKFWGYVRRPGQPWRTAQLVMLNENQKLAPDREANQLGADDNAEYRLHGRFTGEKVYEPPSNRLLPEFLLTGYELLDRNPTSIFPSAGRLPDTVIKQPE